MNGTEKQNETSMEMPAEDSRVTMGNQAEKKHRFHLKMPQKGRKHSVKKRIAYTFIATMAVCDCGSIKLPKNVSLKQ